MKNHFFTLLALLFICTGNCVTAQITFQKTFGGTGSDYGFSAQQTSDGGFIISGRSDSLFSLNYYVYLIRLDANGNTLWTRKSRTSQSDWSTAVQQTTDGGFIITGGAEGDITLMKTDSIGNTSWIKSFNSSLYCLAKDVKQTNDGGYVLIGHVSNLGPNQYDVFLVKTDAFGDTLWTKTYGGLDSDKGNCVQQTTDGGYIITGETESFGTGNSDIYLIKTDLNGDILWSKTLGGIYDDVGYAIEQTLDGGYIITGNSISFGNNSWEVYLLKLDGIGNLIWAKTYGGANEDESNSVHQTTDGGFVVVGSTNSFGVSIYDILLIKTNSIGDILWTKVFGGSVNEGGSSVQQTSDKGYIVLGSTSSFGVGVGDIYLIKTDSLGNSGCQQGNPATIVSSTVTQATNPPTQLYSTPISVSTPSIIFGGSTTDSTLCLFVNINEPIVDKTFNISPNPSSGIFNISFQNKLGQYHIDVVNSLGMIIFSDILAKSSMNEVNLRDISDGLYFINLFDGVNYYRKKLIIVNN